MKAITLHEPWASLVALGAKRIETRGWLTRYRGPLAIHVSKKGPLLQRLDQIDDPFRSALLPLAKKIGPATVIEWHLGCVIAIVDMVDCLEMTTVSKCGDIALGAKLSNGRLVLNDNELAFGHYEVGRYAWILKNVRRIDPVPARGMQKLWEWDGDR